AVDVQNGSIKFIFPKNIKELEKKLTQFIKVTHYKQARKTKLSKSMGRFKLLNNKNNSIRLIKCIGY
ncbi:MAG: hypothetical protein K8R68_02325, partial [Bacteroidales bacterium]|nr:hypothetical protein [Bacteroidales bacterium]